MVVKNIAAKLLVAGIVVCVLSVTAGPFLYLLVTDDGQERRTQLLYETDHVALWEACRELSQRAETGSLKPGEYYVRIDTALEVSTFAKVIRDLNPSAVIVTQSGSIIVAMAGGLDHFGVIVYPEGSGGRLVQEATDGNKELLPGLWYCDDGYRELGPAYEKRIEALRPKK